MNQAKRKLRLDTKEFWDNLKCYGLTTELFTEKYINKLLPREMEKDKLPRQSSCDILVLLVGFSYEPLLQSICYYAPKSVLLVLNEEYGDKTGVEIGKKLQKLIKALSDSGLISHSPEVIKDKSDKDISPVGDKPEQIFCFLREHLITKLREGKKVIIDVTGGKKSMVTGAYLFGAYTNTPISYVDFDEYNQEYGRPYGYSHKIGLLENPYEAFQLRNWEQVKVYYQRYDFRTAYELLEQIKDAMESSLETINQQDSGIKLFDTEHIESVNQLIEVLKFYELWDNGNYYDAQEDYNIFKSKLTGFLPPYAVDILGTYWPHGDELLAGIKKLEMGDNKSPSLYVRNPDMLVYAKDELEKIKRLIEINEDYRSALIRSVGLSEVLLKARITCLCYQELLEIAESEPKTQEPKDFYPMDKLPTEIKDWKDAIRKGILSALSVTWIIPALRYNTNKSKYRKRKMVVHCKNIEGDEKTFFVRRCPEDTPFLDKNIILGKERELRNKAVHTYLSVPKKISEKVHEIVESNFEDFIENWRKFMPPAAKNIELDNSQRFKIEDWELLCKWCGINKFLPLLPETEKEEN